VGGADEARGSTPTFIPRLTASDRIRKFRQNFSSGARRSRRFTV